MAESRKSSGVVSILGVLFLLVPLAAVAWYFTRTKTSGQPPGPPLDDLDIVCVGRGDSESMVISLEITQPGKVIRVTAHEGDVVKKGDEILAIDDTQYQLAVKEARAAVALAQIDVELASLKARQFPKQIEVKRKQLDGLKEDIKAGNIKLAQLQDQSKLTSAITKADIAAFEAGLAKLHLAADSAAIELEELQKLDTDLEVRAARTRLETAQVAMQRADAAARDCILRAPSDGKILRLQLAVGGTAIPTNIGIPGTTPPAIVFAPAGPLVVRGEMEQAGLGLVKAGMKAVVHDTARTNAPTWTGRVKRIADWVAPRRSILFEPGELNDVRTTEVVIEFDSPPEGLLIGQRVQVRVIRNP